MDRDPRRPRLFLVGLLLAASIAAVFWPTLGHGFVNYDDDGYVYENPHVARGLGGGGWRWAFTASDEFNWHPLTWISLMLDTEVHGLRAPGFHATNLLLHLLNSLLLLRILVRVTGSTWRSAFAAALFAVHPLHVESVAWISERKDVLSTLFGFLSIRSYVGHATDRKRGALAWTSLWLALGLMAKPMLVTFPLLFLLMDHWPLARGTAGRALLAEKLPLFALVGASSAITLFAQHGGGAVRSIESLGLGVRAANAAVSAVAYLGKSFWPSDLAAFYPHPGASLPAWKPAGSLLVLTAISFAAFRLRRSRPYFAFGWCWYLVALVPVIGLVQVGSQAMADRYTYVPLIGVFVAVAWGATDAVRAALGVEAAAARVLAATGTAVLALLAWRARQQVATWKDGETLFRHALACTARNHVAHNNLGLALSDQGRGDEALDHFRAALEIEPRFVEARVNLGKALIEHNRIPEAIVCLEEALRMRADDPEAHNNLGVALALEGRVEESLAHFGRAIEIEPEKESWRRNLERARALAGGRDPDAPPDGRRP